VPRDLAHIMTSIGYGGGGYGYYSLCDPNYSYSMSSPQTGHKYPTFAFTYDSYIVSHECGHNFSLRHTHDCYWNPPIDTCYTKDDTMHYPNNDTSVHLRLGDACASLPIHPRSSPGSIMSYCANANYTLSGNDFSQFKLEMTFSPRVADSMRANAEKAACIQPPDSARLILLSPRGSESFPGDTTITVTWTSAHLTYIAAEYSSDGGATWNTIADPLYAVVGSTSWQVPNINSQSMLVRVRDIPPSVIADTSLLFFTVTKSLSAVGAAGPAGVSFSITPDPVSDRILLTAPQSCDVQFEIVNELGALLKQGELKCQPGENAIPLPAAPSGIYYFRVTSPIEQTFQFSHIKN
jgi:hypothetical protein